jgi:hypothetical protein
MISKLRNWLIGWYTTHHIKKHNPELYKFLKGYEYKPEDFVEVERPDGEPGLRIHKDAMENLRKLGIDENNILGDE